ncbi:hypothetical protein B0H21DRAFT_450246 [Amylocystis lapponica]|nr:hypothetical protein B0H21DRAFT_450246 [Amylocystis lapponica]
MEYIRVTPVITEPYYSFVQTRQPHHYLNGRRTSFSGRTSGPRSPHPTSIPHSTPPRRTHTTGPSSFAYMPQDGAPWQHMAQTYAWVLEQEIAEMARKNEETVHWVRRQQERDAQRARATVRVAEGVDNLRGLMGELAHGVELVFDEEGPRASVRWRRDAEKLVDEEIRRLHAARLETERCRMAYERRRLQEDAREQRRREKERERAKAYREKADREAWSAYEARWTTLMSSTESPKELTFRTIPWPMFSPPTTVEDITPARVVMFVLSPLHSDGQSRKDRIRNALRKWHPDRFGRLLAKVVEEDKVAVEDGVGLVVRCLNNVLERET